MRWPWAKRQDPGIPPPSDTDVLLGALSQMFDSTVWACNMLATMGDILDRHMALAHRNISECDLLCGPAAISKYLESLNDQQLHDLALITVKQWYYCYATLRYLQSENTPET